MHSKHCAYHQVAYRFSQHYFHPRGSPLPVASPLQATSNSSLMRLGPSPRSFITAFPHRWHYCKSLHLFAAEAPSIVSPAGALLLPMVDRFHPTTTVPSRSIATGCPTKHSACWGWKAKRLQPTSLGSQHVSSIYTSYQTRRTNHLPVHLHMPKCGHLPGIQPMQWQHFFGCLTPLRRL